MTNKPDWDDPINSEGDTVRSLVEELATANPQNLLGLEVVSFSISKHNRDYLVAALRHMMTI